jgi:hypothetical protein
MYNPVQHSSTLQLHGLLPRTTSAAVQQEALHQQAVQQQVVQYTAVHMAASQAWLLLSGCQVLLAVQQMAVQQLALRGQAMQKQGPM